MARTETELHETVMDSWRDLMRKPEDFENLTNSMPRRLEKIIDVKGSKYVNY